MDIPDYTDQPLVVPPGISTTYIFDFLLPNKIRIIDISDTDIPHPLTGILQYVQSFNYNRYLINQVRAIGMLFCTLNNSYSCH